MNKTKGLKYYAFIFLVATVAIAIYVLILFLRGAYEGEPATLLTMFLIPVVFVGFLFIFDKIFNFILPARFKQQDVQKTEYEMFLEEVNKIVSNNMEVTLEEGRRLRESDRFQKSLSQVFTIIKHGENKALTYEYLQKKFKKDTKEYEAINLVIESVKKTGKDYKN